MGVVSQTAAPVGHGSCGDLSSQGWPTGFKTFPYDGANGDKLRKSNSQAGRVRRRRRDGG
jgi:hypothetical protein